MRNGQSSVSWFRGPLAPGYISTTLPLPARSADSLLLYDQTYGMFHTGYAAAWELGRLLALKNQSFSAAQYQWKQGRQLRNAQFEQAGVTAHLPVKNPELGLAEALAGQFAFYRLNDISPSGGFYDLVSRGVNGSSTGNLGLSANDTFGASLKFHGNPDSVQLSPDLNQFSGDFSIGFWFRKKDNPDDTNTMLRLCDAAGQNFIQIEYYQSRILVINSASAGVVSTQSGLGNGAWHHCLLSFKGADIEGNYLLFVDGALNDQTGHNNSGFTPGQLTLGKDIYLSEQYFNGEIANLRLFNIALDTSQVRLVMDEDRSLQGMHPFFNDLKCLRGLPFNYLVPDAALLPVESMRFYYLDNAWMAALLDGAFSLSRITQAQVDADAVSESELGIQSQHAVTGFILRSSIVNQAADLQVDGYSQQASGAEALPDTSRLAVIRMARLSDDVLLCLFRGEVSTVDIHQRPEALHFGFDSVTDGSPPSVVKNMRDATGVIMEPEEPITLTLDSDSPGLVPLSTLAASMTNVLPGLSAGSFAMEMQEGVNKVRFLR